MLKGIYLWVWNPGDLLISKFAFLLQYVILLLQSMKYNFLNARCSGDKVNTSKALEQASSPGQVGTLRGAKGQRWDTVGCEWGENESGSVFKTEEARERKGRLMTTMSYRCRGPPYGPRVPETTGNSEDLMSSTPFWQRLTSIKMHTEFIHNFRKLTSHRKHSYRPSEVGMSR